MITFDGDIMWMPRSWQYKEQYRFSNFGLIQAQAASLLANEIIKAIRDKSLGTVAQG